MQSLRRHSLTRALKGDDGSPESSAQERSQRASQRVPDDPNVSIRVHVRDVVVQILCFFDEIQSDQ